MLRLVSYAYMPSPLPRQVQWSVFALLSPLPAAFPLIKQGRLLQLFFRGLLSVHSRYGLHARGVAKATLYIESSDSFVAYAAASIATGWSEPVPGREFHPLKSKRLSRRTVTPNNKRREMLLVLTFFASCL